MIDPAFISAHEAPAHAAQTYNFHDPAILGTRLDLRIAADSFASAKLAALAARAEIDRLDLILNTRNAGSEISRLNAAREHTASRELFEVIAAAERWRVSTNNAYSARLGRIIDLWSAATQTPSRAQAEDAAGAAAEASVHLDPDTRTIRRPDAIRFAPDSLAKGWIVDRALAVAMAAPGVTGALVDIGGDIACAGSCEGSPVALPDPCLPYDNAPIIAAVRLAPSFLGGAIATSGVGPRDRVIDNIRYSPTLDPRTGWPVSHNLAATTIAKTAADADALATALMVMPPHEALAFATRSDTPARLIAPNGATLTSPLWRNYDAPELIPIQDAPPAAKPGQWVKGWQALATFTAPRRQLIRDPDFRSPYMAMWITDTNNKPIRTLILVGKRSEWQKDNFIWWASNRTATTKLMATRSMGTSGAGVYNVFWDGVDDSNKPVPAGKYILHVETSRERGKHTYRSMNMDFTSAARFKDALAPTEEGGGITVSFDHY